MVLINITEDTHSRIKFWAWSNNCTQSDTVNNFIPPLPMGVNPNYSKAVKEKVERISKEEKDSDTLLKSHKRKYNHNPGRPPSLHVEGEFDTFETHPPAPRDPSIVNISLLNTKGYVPPVKCPDPPKPIKGLHSALDDFIDNSQ